MSEYGYTVDVPEGYDEAVVRTRMAMRGEGFSILSEMHVGGMLGGDAGDARQYLILGVWRAVVSQRQIGNDVRAAVHLPCNVIVHDMGDTALVAALDPRDTVEEAEGQVADEIVDDARAALGRMLQTVSAGQRA